MSLFAGVNFKTGSEKDKDKGDQRITPSSSASAPGHDSASVAAPNSSSAASTPASSTPPAAQVPWSAALRFAPAASRKNKASLATPSHTSGSSRGGPEQPFSGSSSAAAPGFKSGGLGFKSIPSPGPVGLTPSNTSRLTPTSTDHASPEQAQVSTPTPLISAETVEFPNVDSQGRRIFKPPAMTLEAGGAGARQGQKKRQAGQMTGGLDSGSRSKKRGRKNNPALFSNPSTLPFDPDESYNPSRPTDLTEYRAWRKAYREERRRSQREEEAQRRAKGGRQSSDDGSSYYSEDEEEDSKSTPMAHKGWAPPVGLYQGSEGPRPGSGSTTREATAADHEPQTYGSYPAPPPSVGSGSTPSFVVPSHPAAAASSTSNAALTGEDAYQRRLALSQQRKETAEEAYARRAAMSSGTPGFVSPSGNSYSNPPPFPPQPQPPTIKAPPAIARSASPLGEYVALSPGVTPPPHIGSAPAGREDDDFHRQLEERKKAAAAIAARLANIPAAMPDKVPDEDGLDFVERMARQVEKEAEEQKMTFAEKMMGRWGHKEGQGLGRTGEGIVHALSAEHSQSGASSSKKGKDGGAAGGWVQSASAKGRLVNLNEDSGKREQRERYGEPSRIVCLTRLVGKVEDADEELSSEIGEECGKNGIVERVVLHAVNPPPEDPADGLRVFVLFSGEAGAWRTVKEMDGRYFGGRQVRATYYDEGRFSRGDRSGELLV